MNRLDIRVMAGSSSLRDGIRPEIRGQKCLVALSNADMGALPARRLMRARDYADSAAAGRGLTGSRPDT